LQSALNAIGRKYTKISLVSSLITDGSGCEKVSGYMLSDAVNNAGITLRVVNMDDCGYIYSLQTDKARKYSRNTRRPLFKEHIKWFIKKINSDDSVLFVICLNQQPVGMLRFDGIDGKQIEVSIIIDKQYSGLGVAKKALVKSFELQPKKRFKAVVHKDNLASQNVFEKIGFYKVSEVDNFIEYSLQN
jgi:RimJ/RimL family protein N-acetyltransferase